LSPSFQSRTVVPEYTLLFVSFSQGITPPCEFTGMAGDAPPPPLSAFPSVLFFHKRGNNFFSFFPRREPFFCSLPPCLEKAAIAKAALPPCPVSLLSCQTVPEGAIYHPRSLLCPQPYGVFWENLECFFPPVFFCPSLVFFFSVAFLPHGK